MDESQIKTEETPIDSTPVIEGEVGEPIPEPTTEEPETPTETPDESETTQEDSQTAPEETPAEEIVPEGNGTLVDENAPFTIRSDETGDKVYFVREGKRYWIKNPETLAKLGFYLGKEKRLPFSELLAYSEGEPIDLTIPGVIMPWDKPEEEKKPETDVNRIWS